MNTRRALDLFDSVAKPLGSRPLPEKPEGEFVYNVFGTRWRPFVELGVDDPLWYEKPDRPIAIGYPKRFRSRLDLKDWQEEYFELVDVVESVVQARETFSMMELGANFGRWLQMAWGALRVLNCSVQNIFLLAIEGEPTHHAWLRQTFLDNAVPDACYEAIYGAVYSNDGTVDFSIGNPARWRGQAIGTYGTHILTPCFALRTLLDRRSHWDLIDADIQGAEYEVFASCADALDARVRKVHIGTHGRDIEERLRMLFRTHDWVNVWDFPVADGNDPATRLNASGTRVHVVETPLGPITLNDGVQTWLNPRLAASTDDLGR